MRVRIIVVGKPSQYRPLLEEYEKRLRGVEVLEYKESVKDEQIINACKGKIIVLDAQGKLVSSEALAELVQNECTFIIGGSEGLSEQIKNKADITLSFGRITLPHQLARLVLTEQLYRAQTIKEGKKYHK